MAQRQGVGEPELIRSHRWRVRPDPGCPVKLRTLAQRWFDADVTSAVVAPLYDRLHHYHAHVDLARYRTDGTRP